MFSWCPKPLSFYTTNGFYSTYFLTCKFSLHYVWAEHPHDPEFGLHSSPSLTSVIGTPLKNIRFREQPKLLQTKVYTVAIQLYECNCIGWFRLISVDNTTNAERTTEDLRSPMLSDENWPHKRDKLTNEKKSYPWTSQALYKQGDH